MMAHSFLVNTDFFSSLFEMLFHLFKKLFIIMKSIRYLAKRKKGKAILEY